MAEFNDNEPVGGGSDDTYIDPDAGSPEIDEDEPGNEAPKKRIQPWMIILGSLVLAGGAGVFLKSPKSQTPPQQEVQALPAPVPTPIQEPPHQQPVQAVMPESSPEPAGTVTPVATPTAAVPAPAEPPKTTQASSEDVSGIKTQVSDLSDRVGALEKKIDQLSVRKPSYVTQSGARNPHVPRATSKADSGKKADKTEKIDDPESKASTKAEGKSQADTSLSKYRIKAIPSTFQDQAWIEDNDGKVTVVNVGETFAGAKILSIDADHFEIKTDKGTIR